MCVEESVYIVQLEEDATMRFVWIDERNSSFDPLSATIEYGDFITVLVYERVCVEVYSMT